MIRSRPPLGSLPVRRFLEAHWQREPLLVRGALPAAVGIVDGDTLAGLACADEVESRIVLRDPGSGGWACEHGPFPEDRFERLPPSGWTLLVQAVDEWIPALAADVMARFDFLPRWRLDDAMVSYAADGGGVGPHFDYYDVFLVQVAGTRRWRLGQRCDESAALRPHPALKLLERFEQREEHVLEPGDLLYLPPGVAHDGEAVGPDCITCSVGFRAPSHAEILQVAAEHLAARIPEHRRYRDASTMPVDDPFRLGEDVAAALSDLRAALGSGEVEAALLGAFGHLVTLPRSPDLVEAPADLAAARRRVAAGGPLEVARHPASRLAYAERPSGAVLFVDGESHECTLAFARGACLGRLDPEALAGEADRALLLALVEQGSLALLP